MSRQIDLGELALIRATFASSLFAWEEPLWGFTFVPFYRYEVNLCNSRPARAWTLLRSVWITGLLVVYTGIHMSNGQKC